MRKNIKELLENVFLLLILIIMLAVIILPFFFIVTKVENDTYSILYIIIVSIVLSFLIRKFYNS